MRLPLVSVPTLIACGDDDALRGMVVEAGELTPGAVTDGLPSGVDGAAEVFERFLDGAADRSLARG